MSEQFGEFRAWSPQGTGGLPDDAQRVIDVRCSKGGHLVAVVWLINDQWRIEMAIPMTYSGTEGGRVMIARGDPPRVLWELRPFNATRLRSVVTDEPILHCGKCRTDLSLDHERIRAAVDEKQSKVHVVPVTAG